MKRIVALLAALLLSGCTDNSQKNTSALESALDREIVVGVINYPPGLSIDPSTQRPSGIMHDVLLEVSARSGVKFRFAHETTWSTMIEDLNSGKVDVVCTGLWPNIARARRASFTKAVYYSPVYAYATDAAAYDKLLKKDADLKIATIDGEMSSIIAREDFASAKTVSLTQSTEVAQLLLEVSSRKADVTFVEPYLANRYLATNQNALYRDNAAKPLRVFANSFMVRRDDQVFINFLNTAIEELQNTGFVDRKITEYVGTGSEILRVAVPYER